MAWLIRPLAAKTISPRRPTAIAIDPRVGLWTFECSPEVGLSMVSVMAIEPEINAEAEHRKIDGDICTVENGEVDWHER